jgi:hypothetical protein
VEGPRVDAFIIVFPEVAEEGDGVGDDIVGGDEGFWVEGSTRSKEMTKRCLKGKL